MNSMLTRVPLPATNCDINVLGIQFDATAHAAYSLSGNESASRTQEAVEHKISTGRTIEDCVGNQSHGFHGRVQGQEIAFIVLLLR
jgi:hypothetical protein